jgi:uncharacterized repeat protein (TIGR01451 family)/CSLREA domain-containing protein
MSKIVLACIFTLVVVGISIFSLTPVQAGSTITVTTTSDELANNSQCSLREAIIAANTDSAYYGCPAGNGEDLILFDSGLPSPALFSLTKSGSGEDNALSGDLDILEDVSINGDGLTNTILDGNSNDRLFEIHPGAQATISGLTLQNGDPGTGAEGGGIKVDITGALTITQSAVLSNTATAGGGIQVDGTLTASEVSIQANTGGGIYNDGGTVTLTNVDITDNVAGYGLRNQNLGWLSFSNGQVDGNPVGGIYNTTSTANLSNLTIINNSGNGGVHSSGTVATSLTISQSTILTNTATLGGGVYSAGIGAKANIYTTRIRGNNAITAGGGVYNNGSMTIQDSTIDNNQSRSGGGIDTSGTSLSLINVTLSNNSAGDNGGGLHNRGTTTLTNVTLVNNSADGPGTGGNLFNDNAEIAILNTIIADAVLDGNCFNSEGFIHSLGHNLESEDTCEFSATGDQVNTDPLLGLLQNNGGLTPTHALLENSPAIDMGDDNNCPNTDQRGVTRPQGNACDVGAYEYLPDSLADLAIAKFAQPNLVQAGTTLTYTIQVSNAGPDLATSVTVIDDLPPTTTYQEASGLGWDCNYNGSMVTCTKNNLAAGANSEITILVTAPMTAGEVKNLASVGSIETDPETSNNTSMCMAMVQVATVINEIYLSVIFGAS